MNFLKFNMSKKIKYDDQINFVIKELKEDLSKAVENKSSEFREFVFSTITKNNSPNSRTVILREFEQDWILKIHSDIRALKVQELKKNEDVCLLFYSNKKKIQLRLYGKASIKKNDLKSWNGLSKWSKKNYISYNTPGNEIELKNINIKSTNIDEGINNFCTIIVKINEIDWLCLSRHGNKRAKIRIKRSHGLEELEKIWIEP